MAYGDGMTSPEQDIAIASVAVSSQQPSVAFDAQLPFWLGCVGPKYPTDGFSQSPKSVDNHRWVA